MDILEHREEQIKHAKEKFKDFVPTFKQYNGLSTLDWRNKNGSSEYYIRYIFDEDKNSLYISGDLGNACVVLTEKATLKNLSSYINTVSYFIEKIKCSTDLYQYDNRIAEEEIMQRFEDYFGDTMVDEQWEEIEDMISDISNNYFDCRTGIVANDSWIEVLESYDSDYFDWIYRVGRRVDARVVLWLVGLNMAYYDFLKE